MEKYQTITVAGYDASDLQAIAFGALQHLGWTITHASDNTLLAFIPKELNSYDNEIKVQTVNNQLAVTSKMIHGEFFALMERAKNDIAGFLAAFETIKESATTLSRNEWKEKIEQLKVQPIVVAEVKIPQPVQIETAIKLPAARRKIPYGIIAAAIIVLAIVAIAVYLQNHTIRNETRYSTTKDIDESIRESHQRDTVKLEITPPDPYDMQMAKFRQAEDEALAPFLDASLTDEERVDKLKTNSLPAWDKANEALVTMKSYDIPAGKKERIKKLQQYVALRKKQVRVIEKWVLKKDLLTQYQMVELNNKIDSLRRE